MNAIHLGADYAMDKSDSTELSFNINNFSGLLPAIKALPQKLKEWIGRAILLVKQFILYHEREFGFLKSKIDFRW